MSTTYKISQLRDLFNDWETGLDNVYSIQKHLFYQTLLFSHKGLKLSYLIILRNILNP